MSTPSNCRREEVATCQPDKTVLVVHKGQAPRSVLHDDHEQATMSEAQFMRDHSLYSAASSWLFAIAGATNIGVLSVLASRILTAAEKGQPILKSTFSNKKYNLITLGMMAFGGACMAVSNWLESKKVVTEWQLGAGKLQRKAAVAENRGSADTQPNEGSCSAKDGKCWTSALENTASNATQASAIGRG